MKAAAVAAAFSSRNAAIVSVTAAGVAERQASRVCSDNGETNAFRMAASNIRNAGAENVSTAAAITATTKIKAASYKVYTAGATCAAAGEETCAAAV